MAGLQPPSELDGLRDYLAGAVPGFADSPELAGVSGKPVPPRPEAVAAALGDYLLRLQAREIRREAEASETEALEEAYTVLEDLAASENGALRDVLRAEILEHLHRNDVVVAVVESRLGPRASALYRRWAV